MTKSASDSFLVRFQARGSCSSNHSVRCIQPILFLSHTKSAPTSQQYFSLIKNQHQSPASVSQQYFSLIKNQHQPAEHYEYGKQTSKIEAGLEQLHETG